MTDIDHQLRRYSEANRALSYFDHGTPEHAAALATLSELRPILSVARDVVAAPDGTEYIVSTINRESSAMLSQHWYAETMVWCGNDSTPREDRKMVWQGEAWAGSTKGHETAVELVKAGRIEVEEYE